MGGDSLGLRAAEVLSKLNALDCATCGLPDPTPVGWFLGWVCPFLLFVAVLVVWVWGE